MTQPLRVLFALGACIIIAASETDTTVQLAWIALLSSIVVPITSAGVLYIQAKRTLLVAQAAALSAETASKNASRAVASAEAAAAHSKEMGETNLKATKVAVDAARESKQIGEANSVGIEGVRVLVDGTNSELTKKADELHARVVKLEKTIGQKNVELAEAAADKVT